MSLFLSSLQMRLGLKSRPEYHETAIQQPNKELFSSATPQPTHLRNTSHSTSRKLVHKRQRSSVTRHLDYLISPSKEKTSEWYRYRKRETEVSN